jgi:hypothetical protein
LAGRPRGTGLRRPGPWAVAAVLVGAGAVALYRTTLLPGVGAWDTAEAQTVLPLMGTMHPTGFPAFVLLGWLASVILQPLGEPAFRMNLLAALLARCAAGTTVLVLRRLSVPLPVAAAAAVGLALTPIAWHISSAIDAHALHLALLALVVLTLLRWAALADVRRNRPDDAAAVRRADRALLVASGVFGVSLANHALTLLLIPAVGLYVLAVEPGILRRPRLVAAALGTCLGVAALLYLELPLRAGPFPAPIVYGSPDTWDGFWEVVLGRQFQGDAAGMLSDLPAKLATLASFSVAQLGALALLVPPAFLVTAVRFPRYALLSGVATGLTCLFAASYVNASIERYYLGPAFFAWTWLAVAAATAAQAAGARLGRTAAADRPAGRPPRSRGWSAARLLPVAALSVALLLPTIAALPARRDGADRSHDHVMEAWLDEAMASLDRNAVVLSWWSYSTTLWYGQLIEGRRPDVTVIDDRTLIDEGLGSVMDAIDANLGRRPVYVIRAQGSDLQALAVRYVLEPVGRPANLYRVTGPQETKP